MSFGKNKSYPHTKTTVKGLAGPGGNDRKCLRRCDRVIASADRTPGSSRSERSERETGKASGTPIHRRSARLFQFLARSASLPASGRAVQPPTPSWGLLIKDGADRMREAWWMLVFPGVLFATTLFSFNFVGDGLRDALDPKTSKD